MTCSSSPITFVMPSDIAQIEPEYVILAVGEQGPPGVGIPGPAGGSAFQRTAGQRLSALRAVYEVDGMVYPLDHTDAANIDLMVGLTLTAAEEGAAINIQASGPLDDAGWHWTPGRLWLGADGTLTQTPPTTGFNLLVGAAVSSTRIILNLQDPIELE